MRGALLGAASVFHGAVLVVRPGVRHFAWLPLLVNIVVFAALVWLSGEAFDALLNAWLAGADGIWWTLLRGLAWLFFSVAVVLVSFFTFTLVANLIASPFNEALAAAVAVQLGLHAVPGPAPGWAATVSRFPAAIAQEIGKWLYFARWLLPALLLFLVPGLQLLAPLLWLVLAAWLVALEYLEFPAGNQGLDFRALRRQLGSQRAYVWGFGGTIVALALIPGINLVLMPIAVSGATVLFHRHLADPSAAGPAPHAANQALAPDRTGHSDSP